MTITPEGHKAIQARVQDLFNHTELVYKITADNRHEFTLGKQIKRKLLFKPEPSPYVMVDLYTRINGERVQNITDMDRRMGRGDALELKYPVKVVLHG